MPKTIAALSKKVGGANPPLKEIYLGIDPGASGGLAVLATDTQEAVPMPETEKEVWEWFRWYVPGMKPFAVIEKVGGFIQGNAAPGSAMFNFGWGYGGLRMALVAAGIPFEEVTPQRWQKALGISPRRKGRTVKQVQKLRSKPLAGGCCERFAEQQACECLEQARKGVGDETKTAFKNRLKAKASQLYPSLKVTLATADALLIATYCQRWRTGTL